MNILDRERLVLDNTKLVYNVIWDKFKGNISISRLDRDFLVDELVGVGNLALVKASQMWDETRGIKFSTYATTSITNHIISYFNVYESRVDDGESTSMNAPISDEEGADTLEDVIGDDKYSHESDWVINVLNFAKTSKVKDIDIILDKLLDGHMKSDIARELNLSPQTLRKRIMTFANELERCGLKK